ncbi:hypothetical protein ABEB36_009695 [Hypothenemus hampei]|uniref:Uncharacterized protein n=1 Tax=Hypothenemus hampei TaxID=57062 RepID=A0ABD1EH47_HYPHA
METFFPEKLLLTGTKKMCEEGDCGVCVMVRIWSICCLVKAGVCARQKELELPPKDTSFQKD